ncbi:MAG: MerR family transcriptional regulator [Pseudomonadales bacterium]
MNRPIKMKELETRTGVGREAIRFYIREGILPEPHKPKPNVAHYTEEHVRRLLAIRHLQEERDMPLARIRAVLASAELEPVMAARSLHGIERLLPALMEGVRPAPDQRAVDVLAREGLTTEEFERALCAGVISATVRNGERWLSYRDCAILQRWGALRQAGFSRERGYDLSLLERYHGVARTLASQEVDQFFDAFSGDVGTQQAAEIAARGITLVNEMFSLLHIRALLAALEARLEVRSATP